MLYYMMDLCVRSNNLNAWAGLAMSISPTLEMWLNNFQPNMSEETYLSNAKMAQRSYQHAMDLNLTIWTECGNFVYTVHSHCSRLMKQQSDSLSMERFEILEDQRDDMLNMAMAWQLLHKFNRSVLYL